MPRPPAPPPGADRATRARRSRRRRTPGSLRRGPGTERSDRRTTCFSNTCPPRRYDTRPRLGATPIFSRCPGRGVDPELVRAQVQTSVAGVGVRPEHQRAVGLRPSGVRRGRYDDLAAGRELRDRPRRQGGGGAGTVADVVIDDPSGLGPADLDDLDQARPVRRRFDPDTALDIGCDARAIVGLVRDPRDLGRRPEAMPAEQPVRRPFGPIDRRVRKDRQHVVLVTISEQPDDPRTGRRAHDRRVGSVFQPDAFVSRERDDLERHRAPSSRSIVS